MFKSTSEESPDKREQVATELRAVMREAERLLQGNGSSSAAALTDTRARLEANLAAARRGLDESADSLLRRTRDVAQSTDEYVHAHVWQTIGVGALAGLVLGMLMARR